MENLHDLFMGCVSEIKAVHIPVREDRIVKVETVRLKCMGECEYEYKDDGYWFVIRIKKELLNETVDVMELNEVIVHELLHTVPRCLGHGKNGENLPEE